MPILMFDDGIVSKPIRKEESTEGEKFMKRSLAIFSLVLFLAGIGYAEYPVGAEPPDFGCNDTNGNPWNLYAQRGKVMLINFGATW